MLKSRTRGVPSSTMPSSAFRATSMCSRQSGAEASTTSRTQSAPAAAPSVLRNVSTRSCGSLRTNPTVSVSSAVSPPILSLRVVLSSVAKRRSSARTEAPVSRFVSDDLPALVWPTTPT